MNEENTTPKQGPFSVTIEWMPEVLEGDLVNETASAEALPFVQELTEAINRPDSAAAVPSGIKSIKITRLAEGE